MSIFSNLPEWNGVGTEPSQTKKDAGWQAGEKPPADWFNWLFNRTYESLIEVDSNANTLDDRVTIAENELNVIDSNGDGKVDNADNAVNADNAINAEFAVNAEFADNADGLDNHGITHLDSIHLQLDANSTYSFHYGTSKPLLVSYSIADGRNSAYAKVRYYIRGEGGTSAGDGQKLVFENFGTAFAYVEAEVFTVA
jgi:hypothetical protein